MKFPPHSTVENVPSRMHQAMPAQPIQPLTGRYLFTLFTGWILAEQPLVATVRAYPARYGASGKISRGHFFFGAIQTVTRSMVVEPV